jgi:hypothetical protein
VRFFPPSPIDDRHRQRERGKREKEIERQRERAMNKQSDYYVTDGKTGGG